MIDNGKCLYESNLIEFLDKETLLIYGEMSNNYHGDETTNTKKSWLSEINILKNVINNFVEKDGKIIFEYNIPRLGKRIDAVLLYKGIVFCLEFKVGESRVLQNDIDQVFDYALDLKNFHKYSLDKIIVPILICTKCRSATNDLLISVYDDKVINPLIANENHLFNVINLVLKNYPNEQPLNSRWLQSPYAPTPTIIEAARSLYENHSVESITRHEADNVSTDKTISFLMDVINKSKNNQEKSICFVTGVPGAGKTLVGLDVAIKQTYQGGKDPVKDESAVYLSGNGPLVAVLVEALAQDNWKKCRDNKIKKNKTDSRREVKKSIQMIHRYRETMLAKIKNPIVNGKLEIDPEKADKNDNSGYSEVEHIAIFDEAQRSWTQEKLKNYLKRGGTYGNKIKIADFPMSEAEFLIWSLDLRKDWATIICLVGGGQEINTGEAGIAEWLKAINDRFKNWKVYISPNLTNEEYASGNINEILKNNRNVIYSECLHLAVSLRSFRAEKLSAFVNNMLSFNSYSLINYKEIKDKYPIVLTRDISKAKAWLHNKVRGTERTGILITKESARFKPLGVHVLPAGDENAIHWFLDDKIDTRSSNYLEDAATEIQVQGLELDYTCVLWDADMRYVNGNWHFYKYNGSTKWNEIIVNSESKEEQVKYMLNAYRVLLTRARMGMVICVPAGNKNKNNSGFWEDSTRLPYYYDGTYEYLKSLGIEEL